MEIRTVRSEQTLGWENGICTLPPPLPKKLGPSSYIEKGASCCRLTSTRVRLYYLVEKLKPEMFFITET